MPFVRFSRDKRGYEHTYLIQAAQRKGAPARVLYWYRTPPGVKVGRPAFDDDVRRALEAQYPHIAFDWPSLLSSTIPPVEVEHWRERRLAEKAAKQARQAAVRDDGPEDEELPPEATSGEADEHAASPYEPAPRPAREWSSERRAPKPSVVVTVSTPEPGQASGGRSSLSNSGGVGRPDEGADAVANGEEDEANEADGEPTQPGPQATGADRAENAGPAGPSSVRKRRRRGGRRRRRAPGAPSEGQVPPPTAPSGGSEPSE